MLLRPNNRQLDSNKTHVLPMPTGHVLARRVVVTVLWTAVFAAAVTVSRATHLRLPGHSAIVWLPALFLGRSCCKYRGSAVVVGVGGGSFATMPHHLFDGRVIGFLLGALVIETVMMLAREDPGFLLGLTMGVAANLGKIVPKVVAILAVGATPHHTQETLPFMLVSYVLFGAAAGLVSVVARKGWRNFRE